MAKRCCFTFMLLAVLMLVHLGRVRCSVLEPTPDEKRLLDYLFRNYSTSVRPVAYKREAINVTCDSALQTVTDFNQKHQFIQISLWFRFAWEDHTLQWNPEDYGGASTLVVPNSVIWTPDITNFYSRDLDGERSADHFSPTLTHTGTVYWNRPGNLKTPCKVDPSYFPFDEQRCTLTFGSWSYNDDKIHLVLANTRGDISIYKDNGIWELLGVLQEVNYLSYNNSGRGSLFGDFTITIILRRRPLFYLYNLMIPCAVLSLVTIFCFLLAADSGEKISLVVTNLLSLIVFMLQLSDAVPSTLEGIPLMAQYNAVTIGIVSISMVMSVLVLRIHHRPNQNMAPVPAWLKRLTFKYMASVLNVWTPESRDQPSEPGRGIAAVPEAGPSVTGHQPTGGDGSRPGSEVENELTSVEDHVRRLASHCRARDQIKATVSDWKYVARVIDRFLFAFFLLATLIFSIAVFAQRPPGASEEQIESWKTRD